MKPPYIRRAKKEKNYTVIDNNYLFDNRLSFKAKGLLSMMLSRPDDWIFHNDELMSHSTDGEKSFRAGFKELQECGYVERFPIYENRKIVRWVTIVNEVSETLEPSVLAQNLQVQNLQVQNLQVQKVQVGKVDVQNLQVQNDTLLNTDINQILNKPRTDNPRKRAKRIYEADSDEMVLVNFFISEIRKNDPKFKEPNKQTWADEFRKLIELDQRDKSEISKLIRWVQQDAFWKSNILSPRKLKEKYSALVIKMNDEHSNEPPSEYIPPKVLTIKADTGPNYD